MHILKLATKDMKIVKLISSMYSNHSSDINLIILRYKLTRSIIKIV